MSRIGGEGPVFGTSDKIYGIFESHDKQTQVDESKLQRGDGEVFAVEQTTEEASYSFEYTYVAPNGPDEDDVGTGTAISLPGTAGAPEMAYVKSITDRQQKGGWRTVSGEATSWPSLDTLAS